jgi:two-component system, NarL family, nitrate/nitrite response regulator NarL
MESSPPNADTYRVPVNGSQPNDELRGLLRQIIDQLHEKSPPNMVPKGGPSTEEIVLDVRMDGSHYILTRSCPSTPELTVRLSARETEIVRLVAKGRSNKVIAAVLEISPWTVATHIRRIFGKLGANTRAEMVALASRYGFL